MPNANDRTAALPLSERGQNVLWLANIEAQRLSHEHIDTEHVLLGLLKEDGVATKVLDRLGVEPDAVRKRIGELVQSGPDCVTMGKLPLTQRAKAALVWAEHEARDFGHGAVGPEHLLLGLLRETEGVAHCVLWEFGLRVEMTRLEIHRLLGGGEKSAAEPPKEESSSVVLSPDDDRWKLPPFPKAVTGVVRLRNGDEVPVRRQNGRLEDVVETCRRYWWASGEWSRDTRHPNDIIAQVSVGPTGPGVYEVATGKVRLHGQDERGWFEALPAAMRWDDFGRPIMLDGRHEPRLNLRRRIGDLPDPVPAEVQDFVAAVETAMEAAKTAEPFRDACERLLGFAKRALYQNGRAVFFGDDLPPLVAALAEAAGKRDEPEPAPERLTAAEARRVALRTHEDAQALLRKDRLSESAPADPSVIREIRSREGVVMHGDRERAVQELVASVEPIRVGRGHADYRCRNGKVRHLYGLSDMGFHLSHAVPDGDDDGKPHHYLPDGRERAGDREWDVVAVVPPEPSYPAAEGQAAMAAIWGWGVPTVDAKMREWLREMVREVVAADVTANRQGFLVTATPERFALSEADLAIVPRDDLRVLFAKVREVVTLHPGHYMSRPQFLALSRAAAALGETLPEWMTDHARKEGWA